MGWEIGYDDAWKRDIGYGVPSICDNPSCDEKIDRGLGYVCGEEVFGGEHGCGLYFCAKHLILSRCDECELGGSDLDESDYASYASRCVRCDTNQDPFEPSPDVREWVLHKLIDESWFSWRKENPKEVKELIMMAFKPINVL